jgi:hypothetical protein
MSAKWLFVLLLATGVVLAEEAPEAKHAAAPAKKEKAHAKSQEQAPAKKEEAPPKSQEEAQAKTKEDAKEGAKEDPNLGMSILGNQEAPKALVIVPWKSSEIGNAVGIAPMLDDSRSPVDKEVFMRVLSYYEVRSTTARPGGAAAGGGGSAAAEKDAAQAATAAHRRKP